MKNTEKTDLEKLEEILGGVEVPFSEYKDTYNKMRNAKKTIVDMDEDSQEATIVENAIMGAARKGILTAEEAFIFMSGSIMAFLSHGQLLGLVYNDKKKGICLAGGFPDPILI